MRRTCRIALATLLLVACGPSEPRIRVEDAWSRPTAGDVGVVYFSLVNEGRAADRLTGVDSPVCASAEIHETTRNGDRTGMVPIDHAVEIPARGRVAFEPGGYHVMLVGLENRLSVGDRIDLILEFEKSGPLALTSQVRRP